MIKNYSIYTKLIILFVVTFFLVCVLFIVLLKIEGSAYNEEESLKQENLIKNLLISYENTSGAKIGSYLENSGFNAIQNPHLVKTIKNNGQLLFKADGELCTLSSLKYHSNLYFDIQCKNFDGLYEDNTSDRVYNLLLIGFFSFSLLVVFMYFSVLKSLEPLKKLRRQVAEVTNGEQPDFLDYQEDEVGKIAFEFQKAFKKNQELIQSRQLFLRTIMHELKTPIGKGRIISEMIKEDRQKERLIAIFLRMDSLINEFAKIENLFSKNYNLHFKPSRFSAILEEAKEHLMRDDFNKVVKVDIRYDALINVDMEIFSVILKNLIDNALKYSNNGTCELFCCKECFTIKNPGKPLAEPIEHYLEAFTREKHNQVKGMGLGLYIVSEVCKLHNFDLIYFYDDGKHCFKIFFGDKEK
ncbi:TPA: HAMP domain-containing histidine kinase [Campylobacter jejuni]|uniref:ArsS family sensor histidine kinase n=1 Tax=Campylobacter jejuni TaxID=197 RepID=UPI00127FE4D0|nr:ArsS family sensor histidine kinase [Campylobacter jejuni]EAI3538591.1 HAMP domain-containing histidine kinase [Campylobacter jejuni]EAM0092992.1 sensor histidine kinase [Campylobacter jejuni]ECL4581731.1 HAMP domain-containing histidine kinase [Campylobacter jejuni]ECR1934562.1 HAMP domain-containing histidine kinase [Campylobacter jejuni]EGS9970253.1 HAMP domain-containing histidine kinase [Campylobacter jejuni]